jgi:hypothetical protein
LREGFFLKLFLMLFSFLSLKFFSSIVWILNIRNFRSKGCSINFLNLVILTLFQLLLF